MERELTIERTHAGLAAARAQGPAWTKTPHDRQQNQCCEETPRPGNTGYRRRGRRRGLIPTLYCWIPARDR
ncbi:hypothetical protein [Pseudarthrobacter albicanus]|uniref:hypothetical protein n=1 Tax=Pseudarthrobacter albicanus TaxID=2823873 RepID=UPI002484BDB7